MPVKPGHGSFYDRVHLRSSAPYVFHDTFGFKETCDFRPVTGILLQPRVVPVKTREHWPEVTSLINTSLSSSSINTSLSSQITPPFAPIWSSKSPYLQAAALPISLTLSFLFLLFLSAIIRVNLRKKWSIGASFAISAIPGDYVRSRRSSSRSQMLFKEPHHLHCRPYAVRDLPPAMAFIGE